MICRPCKFKQSMSHNRVQRKNGTIRLGIVAGPVVENTIFLGLSHIKTDVLGQPKKNNPQVFKALRTVPDVAGH